MGYWPENVASGCKNDESEGNSEYDEDDEDQCDGRTLQGKLNNVEVEAPPTPVEQVIFFKAPTFMKIELLFGMDVLIVIFYV